MFVNGEGIIALSGIALDPNPYPHSYTNLSRYSICHKLTDILYYYLFIYLFIIIKYQKDYSNIRIKGDPKSAFNFLSSQIFL